jgi:hypothetical protein
MILRWNILLISLCKWSKKGQDVVDSNITIVYMDDDSIVIVDSYNIKPKGVKIGDH